MCLHLYEPGGHTSGELPIQQVHHVYEQLKIRDAMKREPEVGSTQTEDVPVRRPRSVSLLALRMALDTTANALVETPRTPFVRPA
jgi:hypothetical protein